MEFLGQHELESTNANEILDDLYVETKAITQLNIRGRDFRSNPSKSISIRIKSADNFILPLSVEINGDREASVIARNEIESVIEGAKEWYSRFLLPAHPVPLIGYFIGVFVFVAAATFGLYALFFGSPVTGDQVKGVYVLATMTIYGFVLIAKPRLFPRVAFDIGKSSSAIRSARLWRNILFTGVALSLVVGVVAGLMTERLK